MLKKTLIPFLLTFVLASCISSVEMVQTPIVFNPVIGHEVRSSEMSIPFPEDKTFGVWAVDNNTGRTFVYDHEISCKSGLWTSEYLPLWPESSLLFHAYSPFALGVEFSNNAIVLDSFNIGKDGEEFLYAQTSTPQNANGGKVKLQFSHALSRIDMRIKSGYGEEVEVRIDKITLKRVADTGNFNSSQYPQWTTDESTIKDIVIFDSERDGNFLAGPNMQYIGDIHTIIPQKSGSSIEVCYAFRIDDGDWIDGQRESTSEIIVQWEPGRYYTYSLTINEVKLSYTTGIGHWIGR